jgi:hypothetical protein
MEQQTRYLLLSWSQASGRNGVTLPLHLTNTSILGTAGAVVHTCGAAGTAASAVS